MGFWSWLLDAPVPEDPVRERSALPLLVDEVTGDYGSSTDYSRITVTTASALRHPAAWSCIRLISDVVSSLPVDCYRAGEREPLEKPRILTEPAAGWTFADWCGAVLGEALASGNTFGRIVARDGIVRPSQIELLGTGRVSVTVGARGELDWRLDGKRIDRADLWHFRAYPVAGSEFGLSPVDHARQALTLGLAAEAYGAAYFRDGAHPAAVLTSDQGITATQAAEMSGRWEASHRGRRRTAVLGNGLHRDPVQDNPEQSQMLGVQSWTVQQIARVYNVPPEMIGADSGNSQTYANVEQRAIAFLTYCIGPWVARLERSLNLLVPRGTYAKFNTGALLRTDLKTRYESYALALGSARPWLTVDEVRELEDRPPLPVSTMVDRPADPPPLGVVA